MNRGPLSRTSSLITAYAAQLSDDFLFSPLSPYFVPHGRTGGGPFAYRACMFASMISSLILTYPSPSSLSHRVGDALRISGKNRSSRALSPVVDRWVPVLEQGLNVASEKPVAIAAGSDYVEKERLHWSGLHVALQVRRLALSD